MYFLDTNVLYWYYGRSSLGMKSDCKIDAERLTHFLDGTKNKGLAVSAFVELVVHFRDDIDQLQALMRFIRQKEMGVFNNVPYYCLRDNDYMAVLNMDVFSLEQYAKKMVNEKIAIETCFTVLFLQILIELYLHYRLEATISEDRVYKAIMDFVAKRELQCDKAKISETLQNGYKEHDEERYLKERFLALLEENCLFINMLTEMADNFSYPNSDFLGIVKRVFDQYQVDRTNYEVKANQPYLMTMIKNELASDSEFITKAKHRIAGMFYKYKTKAGDTLFIQEQCQYIKRVMLDAWIDRGRKYEKNDIFDMLFIGCYRHKEKSECVLEDANSYLISFDKEVIKGISEYNKRNASLIDSFYY